MKIYIVQPMGGRTKEEILEAREMGKKIARVYYPKAEFLENYYEDYDPQKSPIEYLARSCELLAQADLMVLLPFFSGTPGCTIEDHIAQVYGIPRLIIEFAQDEHNEFTHVYPVEGESGKVLYDAHGNRG